MASERTPIVLGMLFLLGTVGGFVLSLEISPPAKDTMLVHKSGAGAGGSTGAIEGTGQKRAAAGQGQRKDGSGLTENGIGGDGGNEAEHTESSRDGSEETASGTAGSQPSTAAATGKTQLINNSKTSQSTDIVRSLSEVGEATGTRAPISTARSQAVLVEGKEDHCEFIEITGSEASAFLSGNTVNGLRDKEAEPELIFFSPRGFTAHFHQDDMTVRAWTTNSATVCDRESTSTIACDVLQVRKCLDQRRYDFHIGDFRARNGHWVPIIKGNLQGYPEYLPYFDSPDVKTSVSVSKGQKNAFQNVKGRERLSNAVFQLPKKEFVDRDEVVFFAEAGRRFQFIVPTVEEVMNGVVLKSGWWKQTQDVLCESIGHDNQKPSCRSISFKGRNLVLKSNPHHNDIELTAIYNPKSILLEDEN